MENGRITKDKEIEVGLELELELKSKDENVKNRIELEPGDENDMNKVKDVKDCRILCNEFGGDNMVDLNILTVAQPKVTGGDGGMVCPISTEVPTTGDWVSMIVDSGAGESVAPSDAFAGYPIFETDAFRSGLECTAAGGHSIVNQGVSQPLLHTTDGDKRIMTFQIAEVTKILASVSRIVATGHRVVFDSPDIGSYIEHKDSGGKLNCGSIMGYIYWTCGWRQTPLRIWVLSGQLSDSE